MRKILKSLAALALLTGMGVVALFVFDYEYILRGIQVVYLNGYTTAYIEDYKEFDNRKIKTGDEQPWPRHRQYNTASPTQRLSQTNKDLGTIAFLIIKNDSIWYEDYAEEFGRNSKTNSFSMAKSITTALLGKAIKEGKVSGLEQPVADFYPRFRRPEDPQLTLGDLSSMASGLDWKEDYKNPFSVTAQAYFKENIRELTLGLEFESEPGQEFKYLSGNTLLLGMALEKAADTTLSGYLSKNFWKPMGMRRDALWQLDSKESGMEKAYCCIASNARDFARFGKLFKDHGKWNGQQLLDSAFVANAVKPRFRESPEYGYGFWLSTYRGKELFYMQGIHGQYVAVFPEDDVIIVRLGHSRIPKKETENHNEDFYIYIHESYKMLKNESLVKPGYVSQKRTETDKK